MLRYFSITLIVFFSLSSFAAADNGFVRLKSAHSVKQTADRLVKALEAKGMTIFNRIDHAQGAKTVGKSLRPTELVIFGNPKIGTTLMLCSQSIGIDLPSKALVYEDESGQVWLGYNAAAYLAERHGTTGCEEMLKKVAGALQNFAKAATKP